MLSIILHTLLIILLTVITQIGGLIWCIYLILRSYFPKDKARLLNIISFPILYIVFTFIIIPPLASLFGRTAIPFSGSTNLAPHTFLTVVLNRHYVTPKLKNELIEISNQFEKVHPNLKTTYLDANFPFWDGFPLLPHLSHNDGRKIDISFIYSKDDKLTNKKPSRSGYGYYEHPKNKEVNQPKICLNKGYWQYDFPKYLTLGTDNSLTFRATETKALIDIMLKRKQTQKVFIEPHLKSRMNITHQKLRFHGCKAVRHDDHIHYQIK